MSDDNSYFVHEDDWAMIEFMPTAAHQQVEDAMKSVREPGEQPAIEYALPPISLVDLETLFAGSLTMAGALLSGRTTTMKPVTDGFALYHDLIGAVYGTERDGVAQRLYFDNRLCDCDHDMGGLVRGLSELCAKYGLVMADWWLDMVVALEDAAAARAYVEEL